jgi:hypothetical protein
MQFSQKFRPEDKGLRPDPGMWNCHHARGAVAGKGAWGYKPRKYRRIR